MISRRNFTKSLVRAGIASASAPLWMQAIGSPAAAQSSTGNTYKAIILVTMMGGNDGNNMLVPVDSAEYAEYRSLRSTLAVQQAQCNILSGLKDGKNYGMHPSLVNVSKLYNQKRALAIANVGPLKTPLTKAQLIANTLLAPEALLSHPAGVAQWESATTEALPLTGWGGRFADVLVSQSGNIPPLLAVNTPASIFTVGSTVQGVVLQSQMGSYVPLPTGIDAAILALANDDIKSANSIIAQAAQLRSSAVTQQHLLIQAQGAGATLRTQFPSTSFGGQMKSIANLINGRSVVGASRQIFYCQQGIYDSHTNQIAIQANCLSEFDAGIGAFSTALEEMGLSDDVLICTHSDFNRTMAANGSGGSDHAWGNHQLIIGGGLAGGQIIGALPELELNGPSDLNGYGTWIPTLSVCQMTGALGLWLGLSPAQVASAFPDLSNFTAGAIRLT